MLSKQNFELLLLYKLLFCIIIIFDYYSHMLLSILMILLCYIFLITCIPRDFYLMVSIFLPDSILSLARTSIDWIVFLFLFITLKKNFHLSLE